MCEFCPNGGGDCCVCNSHQDTKKRLRTIIARAKRIRAFFDEYAASDPFGWDWPTMRAVFPGYCREYDELKAEYKSLTQEIASGRDQVRN